MKRLLRHASVLLAVLSLSSLPSAQGAREGEGEHWNVAILVYDRVELLDFAGPGEVFAAAGPEFDVYTVAERREPLSTLGLVELMPAHALADAPKPDIIVVPGGGVPSANTRLQEWLVRHVEQGGIVMSVCNGAHLLARAGLLEGLVVTTHRSAMAGVAAHEPTATVAVNRRFVDNGSVVTTAGVSAGIDGALHLVARLVGEERAWRVAEYMEYAWRPDEIAALHAEPAIAFTDVGEELLAAVRDDGMDAALASYRARREAGEKGLPDEGRLNTAGYRLMGIGRLEDAATLLRLAVLAYPASANACDSLSEVLEESGHVEEAARFAARALERLEADRAISRERAERVAAACAERLRRAEDPALSLGHACPPCGMPCDDDVALERGACPGCGSWMTQVTVGADGRRAPRPKRKETGAALFACTPCDRPCDAERYAQAGTCPDEHCGMRLVPVEDDAGTDG